MARWAPQQLHGNSESGNRLTSFDYADTINSRSESADFDFDDRGQLTDADYDYQTDQSYTYDETGNRETVNEEAYSTSAGNRLTSDAEGNTY